MIKKQIALSVLMAGAMTGAAQARDQVQAVGSSTLFPFATAVAEQVGKLSGGKTPIVESTGTGGGFKLFCSGGGENTPDVSNASRQIKTSEVDLCANNGAGPLIEIKIGYDGIVLANSKSATQMKLSLLDIFNALAKELPSGEGKTIPNPNKTWKDVNPSLPDVQIEVMGPPPTSGTRDAFVELAMEGGCQSFPWVKSLKGTFDPQFKKICDTLREDGAWIDAGENDNLIIQKLVANPNAIGVFGYSFLERNTDKVQGSFVENVVPDFDMIAAGAYKISRPLFIYIKANHLDTVSGLKPFIAEFISEMAWGPDGYLAEKGLIPLPDDARSKMHSEAAANAKL
ncbi:MAG: phosphate ABC transporter substrate-binding protein [Alphaproteobacteria bacterium]|nr:phosphate ABC transporter substrate-binding protein [Alphaproteobacteria bacterium]